VGVREAPAFSSLRITDNAAGQVQAADDFDILQR
jgi:hypothetical protein